MVHVVVVRVEVALVMGIIEVITPKLVKIGGETLVADWTTATTTLLVATTLMLLKTAATSASREMLTASCRL